ncbi:hypothetical protein DACRYDRAFT_20822 [Dacryopinax primogenitus]|uniref:Transcription activator of gluconeogenesis ERT1 n=1 Tax=Dacryopinax primogenitus (strain DJM 731) TaxID=1858805 RepID=M5GFL7_DACPD|nr:uncharacterized protein DACRYDRAFT_20822 [Dacryopinax primogenitus]EJU04218.1 hypothetical protein DACRYDRAFT_20822 [Dacryopinax primogenitus]
MSSSSQSPPGTLDPRQQVFRSDSIDTDFKPVGLDGSEKGKSKQGSNLKRKRDTDPGPIASPTVATNGSAISNDSADHPKRKKANRACFACQKAHLTCDDSRPCQRCIKKGCADQCVEGHRKKAKYLLEDEELEALKKAKQEKNGHSGTGDDENPFSNNMFGDSLFNVHLDPSLSFASDHASLEYNVLSQILGSTGVSPPDHQAFRAQGQQNQAQLNGYTADQSNYQITWPGLVQPQASTPQEMELQQGQDGAHTMFQQAYGMQPQPQSMFPASQQTNGYMPNVLSAPLNGTLRLGPPSPPASNGSPSSGHVGTAGNVGTVVQPTQNAFAPTHLPLSVDAADVYQRVTTSYDYTEGYHFLMKFLTERFDKNDILRVVRALAIFRPSLIALQMPLSEEDEVFVEKSFQRTLIELDKLISYSGTPTVVWRRTGEICLVGVEFCVLTEWRKEELLSGKKFIYELFENQSVVEYWEKFASHAFENSSQSVYTHCVLVKADGSPLPCAFCFSIRRDIFALPSVVIGQWLPLL